MKKIILYAVIISLALSSCFLVKSKYFNELDSDEKKNSIPNSIDLNNHESQKSGIYSINYKEFKYLIDHSNADFNAINFHQPHCFGRKEFLADLNKNVDLSKLNLYYISGDDWVYKNNYKMYIDTTDLISKMYLLDVKNYGNIEGWHDNLTFRKRIKAFYSELKNSSTNDFNSEAIDDVPSVIIFDSKSKILLEYFAPTFVSEEE